jgi:hypothetical protein
VTLVQAWPKTVKTLLEEADLKHTAGSLSFQGSEKVYSSAKIIKKDLQKGAKSTAAGTISVQGIDGVLFPSDLGLIVPVQALAKYSYGVDPPVPTTKISECPVFASAHTTHPACSAAASAALLCPQAADV